MPLYYFNLNGRDHGEGLSLADDAAAWEEGASAALELMRGLGEFPKPGEEWTLSIRDAEGQVMKISFSVQSDR